MQKVTFESGENSFFNSIKEKVDRYFSEGNIDPAGNRKLYVKSGILVFSSLAIYCVLIFVDPVAWISIALCVLLGLVLSAIGFNVMHEGGHQSFSKYGWLNQVSAYFLNVLGGNSYFWKIKHNINHHTYTNIEGVDSDIDVKPFMRLHRNQPLHRVHRFQHIYWFILYGISYVAWVFYEDFVKYCTGKVAVHMKAKKLVIREHFIFWFTKICYVSFYVVLPIVMVGWLNALIGFFIITFVTGLAISVVFQLAHVVEGTDFPATSDQSTRVHQEWAVHQVTSTSNFATRNKVWFWLLGGLNFQIEHHLFPRVSHIHYPQISRFVKEACVEYKISYNEHKTVLKAFLSHLLYLRRLGTS